MKAHSIKLALHQCIIIVLTLSCQTLMAETMDSYQIGSYGQANIKYPAWFKESFYDLREDLSEAKAAGKRGILVFFSQKNCNHCQAFIDTTLGDPATQQRVREHYDVIAVDIFNDIELTTVDGKNTTIRDYAEQSRARLTPTLIFYGVEGERLLKIMGLYPPEKFNRVLDYIDGGHYEQLNLSQYLRNTATGETGGSGVMTYDYSLFARPPHMLDRSKFSAAFPLLVVFENPDCGPCRRFHERVLDHEEVRAGMPGFEAVQLDMTDDVSMLVLPDGRKRSPRQWADELQLVYDISVVFFDENGKEVHRLDAETGKDRMAGSLQYVKEKAYLRHEQYLQWRKEQGMKKRNAL